MNRSNPAEHDEYLSSVTLMLLGDEFLPTIITEQLSLEPDQTWVVDDSHEWCGWKKFMPDELKSVELAGQIEYWVSILEGERTVLQQLHAGGIYLALDCFVTPRDENGGTASILLPPNLLKKVAVLGLELRFSYSS